jgi:hypothetical protein
MFNYCESMLKLMKEQKKLDADFFLRLTDDRVQDINELGGFSADDNASWEREFGVHVYEQGVADIMPELGSESELEDER